MAISPDMATERGWQQYGSTPQDDPLRYENYADVMEMWRVNPLAWRIIALHRDHILGDGVTITSDDEALQAFIEKFTNDPLNDLASKLGPMVEELVRSGDLFVLLFRNNGTKLPYIRFLIKSEIVQIDTAENDRELEMTYYQRVPGGVKEWYSPNNPASADADAVCLHYAMNRPIGALFGVGVLDNLTRWLSRYSNLVEARARLHWALRMFLWFVTVPSSQVAAKASQYRAPPEAGAIVVHDESETWQVMAPDLHAADARHDLAAVFRLICVGAGMPAHWLGEQETANLATAQASQRPAERMLLAEQTLFKSILGDIIYTAWLRYGGAEIGKDSVAVIMQDISRDDNAALSLAADQIARAWATAGAWEQPGSPMYKMAVKTLLQFAGVSVTGDELKELQQ